MYTTQKRISKLTNQYIGGPIFAVIGLILILPNFFNNGGIFESIGNLVVGLILIGVGIFQFISSNKKINQIKGQKFNVTDSGIELHKFDHIELIPISEISSINKKINSLEITSRQIKEVTLINLEDYLLSFEESKELDAKISNLLSQRQKETTM
jgi:hypothetical protein